MVKRWDPPPHDGGGSSLLCGVTHLEHASDMSILHHILYYNFLLFMDIFHIRMQYLCYFILFGCLMIVGDLTVGARNQLEKAPSRYCTSTSPKILEKFEDYYFSDDGRSQKGDRRGATRAPGATWPQPPLGRTWWPWVASGFSLWCISPE